jgi:hypothetical protein
MRVQTPEVKWGAALRNALLVTGLLLFLSLVAKASARISDPAMVEGNRTQLVNAGAGQSLHNISAPRATLPLANLSIRTNNQTAVRNTHGGRDSNKLEDLNPVGQQSAVHQKHDQEVSSIDLPEFE